MRIIKRESRGRSRLSSYRADATCVIVQADSPIILHNYPHRRFLREAGLDVTDSRVRPSTVRIHDGGLKYTNKSLSLKRGHCGARVPGIPAAANEEKL